jgi:hypothetical protein
MILLRSWFSRSGFNVLPQTSACGETTFQSPKSRIGRVSATYHISAALSGSALGCRQEASALSQARNLKVPIEPFNQ